MNLNKNEIDKAYVSEHDVFLHQFDKKHPTKSASQQKEIDKHQKIFAQRDGLASQQPAKASWYKRLLRIFYAG